MIQKIILLFTIVFTAATGRAQGYDTIPPYLKNKQLPDFVLFSKDSVAFDQTVLKPGKKTIIMLFNPECEHCQDQLTLMISMPEIKQNVQLLLATTETLEKLNIFYKKYNLQNWAFIYAGKDTKYILGKFFRPKTIPVLAFYDSRQQFVHLNQGSMSRKQLQKVLGRM